MVTTRLNALAVELIFRDSRQKPGDPQDSLIFTPSFHSTGAVAFHKERLGSHVSEIDSLLHQLPPQFMHGEGCPLARGCDDRRGRSWGLKHDVERLLLLGIALGMVKCLCDTESPHYLILN